MIGSKAVCRVERGALMMAVVLALATGAAEFVCGLRPIPRYDDQYDARLEGLRSVDAVVDHIAASHPGALGAELTKIDDAVIRRRFFYGYSYFRPCQNWIAVAAGYVWSDLAAPVIPDDILKFRRAACSQQAIVLQAVMRRQGFTVASVGLPGHFMTAALIDGRWWAFDPTLEPLQARFPLWWLMRGDARIEQLYGVVGRDFRLAAHDGRIRIKFVNAHPAPRAALFHNVTWFMSKVGWMLAFLGWAALRTWRWRRQHPSSVELTGVPAEAGV